VPDTESSRRTLSPLTHFPFFGLSLLPLFCAVAQTFSPGIGYQPRVAWLEGTVIPTCNSLSRSRLGLPSAASGSLPPFIELTDVDFFTGDGRGFYQSLISRFFFAIPVFPMMEEFCSKKGDFCPAEA